VPLDPASFLCASGPRELGGVAPLPHPPHFSPPPIERLISGRSRRGFSSRPAGNCPGMSSSNQLPHCHGDRAGRSGRQRVALVHRRPAAGQPGAANRSTLPNPHASSAAAYSVPPAGCRPGLPIQPARTVQSGWSDRRLWPPVVSLGASARACGIQSVAGGLLGARRAAPRNTQADRPAQQLSLQPCPPPEVETNAQQVAHIAEGAAPESGVGSSKLVDSSPRCPSSPERAWSWAASSMSL